MTPTWRRRLLVTGLLVLDLALVGLLGWMSLFTVEADQSVVVFRHGRPTERQVCRGGLHVKWPWDEVKRLDRRVHLLELDPVERLTARFEPILVQPVVYWRVAEDAAGTFFRTLGDEDAAPRRLADLVWANLDTEIASRSLSSWMGSDEPTDASNEPALPPTIRRIGWATRLKAHDLLGIDVLDVRLRRLTTPDRSAESMYRRTVSTLDTQAARIRLTTSMRLAEAKTATKAEVDQIVAQGEQKAASIRDEGRAEADKIHTDVRRLNPDLADLMRKIEGYRRLVNDNTTIIMTGDDEVFNRRPATSSPSTNQTSQPTP